MHEFPPPHYHTTHSLIWLSFEWLSMYLSSCWPWWSPWSRQALRSLNNIIKTHKKTIIKHCPFGLHIPRTKREHSLPEPSFNSTPSNSFCLYTILICSTNVPVVHWGLVLPSVLLDQERPGRKEIVLKLQNSYLKPVKGLIVGIGFTESLVLRTKSTANIHKEVKTVEYKSISYLPEHPEFP